MISPASVYTCSHTFVLSVSDTLAVEFTRGAGLEDTIDPGDYTPVACERLYALDDLATQHEIPEDHWTFAPPDEFRWTRPPDTGTHCVAVLEVSRLVRRTFAEDDCPRCKGNRWYAGILGPIRSTGSEGLRRLTETVLHCLLCRKGTNYADPNYGTTLHLIPGRTRYDRTEIEKGLRDAIADCAAQIVSYQAEEARRRTLDDSEKLRSLTLDEIVFDDARLAVTARVGLLSAAGRLQFAVPLRQGL